VLEQPRTLEDPGDGRALGRVHGEHFFEERFERAGDPAGDLEVALDDVFFELGVLAWVSAGYL